MEPNRNFGRGSYNRNTNMACNQGRMPMNQNRQMPDTSTSRPMPRSLPVIENDCDCKDSNSHMRHFSVGIGYVPMQEWGELYDMENGFCEGTIFPELNLIFCGIRGRM